MGLTQDAAAAFLEADEREHAAAIILQRRIRSRAFARQATLILAVEMTESKAAIIVQAAWRRRSARREVRRKREEQAAVTLQTRERVVLARKERERRLQDPSRNVQGRRSNGKCQQAISRSTQTDPAGSMGTLDAAQASGSSRLRADGAPSTEFERRPAREQRRQLERLANRHEDDRRSWQRELFLQRTNFEYQLERASNEASGLRLALDECMGRCRAAEMDRLRAQLELERLTERVLVAQTEHADGACSPSPQKGSPEAIQPVPSRPRSMPHAVEWPLVPASVLMDASRVPSPGHGPGLTEPTALSRPSSSSCKGLWSPGGGSPSASQKPTSSCKGFGSPIASGSRRPARRRTESRAVMAGVLLTPPAEPSSPLPSPLHHSIDNRSRLRSVRSG